MRQPTRRTAVLVLLSLLASLLTVSVTAGMASAAESIPPLQWGPVQASTTAVVNVTSPTGSVTVPCTTSRGGSDLKTYSANGTLTQDISRSSTIDGVSNCIQSPVVDKNGDDYGVVGRDLLAYTGNTLKWTYPVFCSTDQSSQVAVGANGNIYATTYESDGVHLIGLTPTVASGQTQPTKVLDIKIQNDCSTFVYPYKYGIMLHGQLGGAPGVYYSYSGAYLGQASIGDIWGERLNDDGRLFVKKVVTGSYHSITVTGSDTAKTNTATWTTTASTPGANATDATLRPMPGGGVAVLITEQQMVNGVPATPTVYVKTLTIINGGGQVVLNQQLPNSDAKGNAYAGTYIAADNTGKVAVVRGVYLPTGLSYPSTEPGISIQAYDSITKIWTNPLVMSGDNSKAGGPYGYQFDYSNQDYALEFASNTLFFNAYCTGNCSDTYDRLYPVNLGGVGNDYPRSTVLSVVPRPATPYIALGDSFSSGEGNPPFLSGTDIAGVNTCHRSNAAYPELISGTSSKIPALGTTGFRACSGAVSGNIWNLPQWNEGIQLDWWPDTSTQLVTLTIGGNDIQFSQFGHACVFGSCDIGSPQYNTSVNLVNNLSGALTTTYQKILAYAPNAQIYVIGYPQVIANYSATDPKIDTCFYMYGGSTAWGNARGAYSLVNLLDKKISDTVTAINNPRLHFIDTAGSSSPFASHLLCMGDPWFQNIDQAFNNAAYVFHPNQAGQEGLATIVGATINAG